jgi:uncharacterized protein YegP (UPF0339 family)
LIVVFKILPTNNRQWYVKIVASNGRTLASSETYWNKADARSAALLIKQEAGAGRIEE